MAGPFTPLVLLLKSLLRIGAGSIETHAIPEPRPFEDISAYEQRLLRAQHAGKYYSDEEWQEIVNASKRKNRGKKIQSWPRWVRYGLLSGLWSLFSFTGFFFSWLLVAPTMLPAMFLFGWTDWVLLSFGFGVGFWTLIGGLLGKFIKNPVGAFLIWLVLQIVGSYLGFWATF